MKDFFVFDEDDKKLWLGLGAAGVIFIVAFTLFGGGFMANVERVLSALAVVVLPGFVIMKLYADNLTMSDNKIADKLMLSFGLSLLTMVVPYFLTTYIRPYVFNADEENWGAISNTTMTFILLVMVIAIAFGVKYYQNKKKSMA
ncbi:MAG: hypothetical protein WCI11_04140 [Candidatus Methylumidiphilus sp.]